MNKYVDSRIVGVSDEDLDEFLYLCRVIQHLGLIGTNRKIEVVVDRKSTRLNSSHRQ